MQNPMQQMQLKTLIGTTAASSNAPVEWGVLWLWQDPGSEARRVMASEHRDVGKPGGSDTGCPLDPDKWTYLHSSDDWGCVMLRIGGLECPELGGLAGTE
ncbi:hypothetical protein NDU88_002258 [Pleurodeles waltl]|uniref:Uncharacterized protein n=1 Tax=Pleurodeles waltl TaxID=8319 RepID=A0AAV7MNV0_PLEWA|nr:hypothetical protein NDU88_002258 [Pleurodeles waltl]